MGPAAIFAVSAGLGIFGNYMANIAESRARRQNIRAFQKQQELARLAALRQEDVFKTESAIAAGEQVHGFAAAGVDLSGSALAAAASTQVQISNELSAIQLGAKRQLELFDIEISKEKQRIKQINDPLYNLVNTGNTLLNAYSLGRNAGLFSPDSAGGASINKPSSGIVGEGSGGALRPSGSYAGGSTRYSYQSKYFGAIGGE